MTTPTPGVDARREISLENLLEFPEGKPLLTCIQCGVCAGTCPYGEVMEYPPRRIIAMMRAGMLEKVFTSDSLLSCVACYACMAKCPRGIRLTEVLLPLMKEQTLLRLPEVPAELQKALENTLRYGNPMGESSRKRAAWVKTAGVPVRILSEDPRPADVLWFVECQTSYYPRGQDNARATARIFHALGIDFAILGNEEKCAGECGRFGETGLFDALADHNMAAFAKYRFNRIVTSGAHAYDAFKYQYPDSGFRYPVEHTMPFLAARLDALKPLLKRKLNYTVTYHDSCCLGRQNEFYEEPPPAQGDPGREAGGDGSQPRQHDLLRRRRRRDVARHLLQGQGLRAALRQAGQGGRCDGSRRSRHLLSL